MATITTVQCDLCGESAAHPGVMVQVKFTSEQTEGRPCTPYPSLHKMDLCGKCYQRHIDNLALTGHGAQGHNTFEWQR